MVKHKQKGCFSRPSSSHPHAQAPTLKSPAPGKPDPAKPVLPTEIITVLHQFVPQRKLLSKSNGV